MMMSVSGGHLRLSNKCQLQFIGVGKSWPTIIKEIPGKPYFEQCKIWVDVKFHPRFSPPESRQQPGACLSMAHKGIQLQLAAMSLDSQYYSKTSTGADFEGVCVREDTAHSQRLSFLSLHLSALRGFV